MPCREKALARPRLRAKRVSVTETRLRSKIRSQLTRSRLNSSAHRCGDVPKNAGARPLCRALRDSRARRRAKPPARRDLAKKQSGGAASAVLAAALTCCNDDDGIPQTRQRLKASIRHRSHESWRFLAHARMRQHNTATPTIRLLTVKPLRRLTVRIWTSRPQAGDTARSFRARDLSPRRSAPRKS